MAAEDQAIDCRSPEGVTVGLIDGIIAAARVVRVRDLTHPAVVEALRDLADDEDVRSLLDAPSGADSPASDPAAEAQTEVARLRAGEADSPGDPDTWPTPAQWIRRWNDATPEQRLAIAQAYIDLSRAAWARQQAAL